MSGKACDETETYALTRGHHTYRIEWLMKQKLIKSYRENSASMNIYWVLERIIRDAESIKQTFANRDAYYTTDYDDIGDNETDQFLLNLVNLGFVGHASGFYQAHGTPIEEHHHAH